MFATSLKRHLSSIRLSSLGRQIAHIVVAGVLSGALAYCANATVGYYQGSRASTFPLKNLVTNGSAANLTYLIYAFEQVGSDGTCSLYDAVTDTQGSYTAATSINGVAEGGGTFQQLRELKKKYKQLKVLVSIGGSTLSGNFSAAAAGNPDGVAQSCVSTFITGTYAGIFDGIDVDWEYPANGDQTGYTNLMQDLRTELNAAQATMGQTFYLTAALGPEQSDNGWKNIDVATVAGSVDFFNMMTYDYAGSWLVDANQHQVTGFNAPLLASTNGSPNNNTTWNNVETNLQQLIGAGVPASQVMMGVPFYGVQWSKVTEGDSSNPGLFQRGTWVGQVDYATIAQTQTQKGLSVYRDSATQSPWLYDGSNFWSFDDPTVMAAKAAYVQSASLAGMMTWDISQDTASGKLLCAMETAMAGSSSSVCSSSSGGTQPSVDNALYNFESSIQSWTTSGGSSLTDSASQSFAGTKSLAITFDGSATSSVVYVLSPKLKAGTTIQFHVYIPAGSAINSINPFAADATWAWVASTWTGIGSLNAGSWNTVSITLPSNIASFSELGIEFDGLANLTGTVYVDSIGPQ